MSMYRRMLLMAKAAIEEVKDWFRSDGWFRDEAW